MNTIFPKEIIEHTVEVHQFKHSSKSKIIYSFILVALIAAFVALPFIKITIYSTSQGLIRPDKEQISIASLTSGHLLSSSIKENKLVEKGDTLLVLDDESLFEKILFSKKRIKEINLFIGDLTLLIKNRGTKLSAVNSPKYRRELLLFKQKQNKVKTAYYNLKINYKRNKMLFEKGVIASVEIEKIKYDYDISINNIHLLNQEQKNSWQHSLTQYKSDYLKQESNLKQLNEESSHFIITAPIKGTLIKVKSVAKGSLLKAGDPIAYISPNTNLIIECLVHPKNIGLLNKKNKVNFQVSAFNYNQWGFASGQIEEIGNDVQMVNNTPMYKVICTLDQNFLMLKNGFKGHLKKGMFVSARFEIIERSLFDLLYDKMDDWLNPANQIAKN